MQSVRPSHLNFVVLTVTYRDTGYSELLAVWCTVYRFYSYRNIKIV